MAACRWLFAAVGLLPFFGCAHTAPKNAPAQVPAAPVPAPLPPVSPAPPTPPAPLPVPGPIPASEEEAEAARQQLDLLPDDEPTRLSRRQGLLDYYCQATEQALVGGHAEEAFQLFGQALSLFEAAELQRVGQLSLQTKLLSAAQGIGRVYSRRGAHTEAVLALAVQIALTPADATLPQRFSELAAWLTGAGNPMRHAFRGRSRSIEQFLADPPATLTTDLERAYQVWPTPFLRDRLVDCYRREAQAGDPQNPRDFLHTLLQHKRQRGPKGDRDQMAFKLARLYLRVSQPQEALRQIDRLGKLTNAETALSDLLRNTVADLRFATDPNKLRQSLLLAREFVQSPDDLPVGLQICRDVLARAPQFAEAAVCVGEWAHGLERKGLAIRAFEQARRLLPEERTLWEKLGLLYLEQLSTLVSQERTQETAAALGDIERYFSAMKRRFPETSVEHSMSLALSEVGRGYYNAGSIPEAMDHLQRAVALSPSSQAFELLGMIHLRRKQAAEAILVFEKARSAHAALTKLGALNQTFYAARISRLLGDAQDLQKRGAGFETRKQGLQLFGELLSETKLQPNQRAEAELERGKLFYAQGDRESALLAFRLATDQLPAAEEISKTAGPLYADVLAFLVQRGEWTMALDVYRRALQSTQIGEPLKVYCSLWVLDLTARAGQPPDPLATALLQSVQGGKWHASLALFGSGKLSGEELLRRADTVGKQAEANFYLAQAAFRQGQIEEAKKRWAAVVQSRMFGFFEYEMASVYLEKGAPPVLASPAAVGQNPTKTRLAPAKPRTNPPKAQSKP